MRGCVDGGGSPPGQIESIGNSKNFFEVGGGGILSLQLILLRGPIIFSKKTNHCTMICQDSRAPSISIELEILWEGGGNGGGGGSRQSP